MRTKVVNQYNTREDFKGETWYGETECCGIEVERSVYGGDEDCPCCGAWLDWDWELHE